MLIKTGGTLNGKAGTASAVTYTIIGDRKVSGVDNYEDLGQGQLSSSTGALLATSPVAASTALLVSEMLFTNTTASPVTGIVLYLNGTGAGNQIVTFSLVAFGSATYRGGEWKTYDSSGAIQAANIIGLGQVTNAMQANMPANSMSGEFTGTASAPQDQVFAANTFPARGSTGNIAPKSITDIGLTWLGLTTVAAQTAALNVVTTSLQGMMSANDKTALGNLSFDAVTAYGFKGDDSTLNDTAWTTAKAAMPLGSSLFFAPGTYRVSAECTIDVDKRFRFKGSGRFSSIIKTTSTTANIFNKTVAGWYDSWEDLGFAASVTKTAGAAIAITAGNNVSMNVYRCDFVGMFIGIDAQGAQSGNVSVWSDLTMSSITNGGRGIRINGSTINVQIDNTTINAGAATTSACVEINQSGAVQVNNFDWIQGTNVILFNSTAGAGPQACYFTNGFCDQPQGSVVKMIGTNTMNRISFTQVGIAPIGNNYAVEINGTGSGAVGTSTALPGGIKLVGCDIYASNGTNTSAGVRVNGCQDITIQNCNISGFNGVGGAAIYVTPSAGNQTKVRINGNVLGPNSNLTINNETGVKLDAGASALGFLSITDNSMLGCTTAITDNSMILATATKNINNNQGAANGLTAQATAGGTLTTTTETVVPGLQVYFPPNSIKVGTVIQWTRMDTVSAVSTTIEKARVGTAGTVADATNISSTLTAGAAAGAVSVTGLIEFTSVGATGAFTGGVSGISTAVASAPTPVVTGTVNTTIGNFVTITTANGTANTRTFRGGTLAVYSPA